MIGHNVPKTDGCYGDKDKVKCIQIRPVFPVLVHHRSGEYVHDQNDHSDPWREVELVVDFDDLVRRPVIVFGFFAPVRRVLGEWAVEEGPDEFEESGEDFADVGEHDQAEWDADAGVEHRADSPGCGPRRDVSVPCMTKE